MSGDVLKPGARLRSTTCTTEVVVVRGTGVVDVRCGGEPMVAATTGGAPTSEPVAPFDQGTQLGKRYADEDAGVELLCTKPGAGSLSVGTTAFVVKGAKPLPASD